MPPELQYSERTLTPEAKQALGGQLPKTMWYLVGAKLSEALEVYPEKSQQLALNSDLYQPEGLSPFQDLNDLLEVVVGMDPVKGLNNMVYLHPELNLDDPEAFENMNSLKLLQALLDMFTKSDRWAMTNGD